MMKTNTATRYGSLARFFHWSIALLVLVDLALGLIGKFTPRTADTVDLLKLLYSAHKTIGVTVLGLAVLRVAWAVTQPRPVPLHPERRMETFAAEAAHWVLYGAIFMLPISGWVMHSAEVGFAPIWWPFGQDLPFVPKSESVAHTAATIHWAAGIVLALTVAAHVSGALKHAVIDRDATLARMWRGTDAGDGAHHTTYAPAVVALVVWGLAIGGAVTAIAPEHDHADTHAATAQPAPADTDENAGWAVQNGTVTITIAQLGAQVSGRFANWQAAIEYDAESGAGTVTAVIDTTSLSLGSVTDQAMGPEFFDAANHSQATFEAAIARTSGTAHTAVGTLSLVGQSVPVTLGFDLDITEGVATMRGTTTLDRRDFAMGASYGDETSVGFGVEVAVELQASPPQ